MQKTELAFQQIYNQLLAGTRLVLHFDNETSAETFRTRMHHHKSKQDQTLEGLGLQEAESRTVLKFKVKKQKQEDGGAVVAYVQFALPSPLKKYPVIILEEKDLTSGSEVSTDLAAA